MIRADVAVVGGGLVGLSTAVALAQLGVKVAVLEKAGPLARQFGGEVLHPRGVAALESLGLGRALCTGHPLQGFHVHDRHHGGVLLEYETGHLPNGMSLVHDTLHREVLEIAARHPLVNLLTLAQVDGIEPAIGESVIRVRIAGVPERVACQLIVGADGAHSSVRQLAGVSSIGRQISTMTLATVPSDVLPSPGHGHLFTGGGPLVFAYALPGKLARVLIDRPASATGAAPGALPRHLPAPMAKAMATGGQVHGVFPTYCVSVPNPCARGVVLIGDAAGTCHPVTASGMTAGLLDASSLLEAFRTSGGNFATLSGHFLRCRGARQKSRLTLASTLYEVLAGEGPEHHLLRASMLRYWRSADGAAASVALLGMSEDRVSELLLAELRIFAGTPRHLRDIPARAPRLPAWGGALGIAFRHSRFLLGGRPPFAA